jgi:hypothetical protein
MHVQHTRLVSEPTTLARTATRSSTSVRARRLARPRPPCTAMCAPLCTLACCLTVRPGWTCVCCMSQVACGVLHIICCMPRVAWFACCMLPDGELYRAKRGCVACACHSAELCTRLTPSALRCSTVQRPWRTLLFIVALPVVTAVRPLWFSTALHSKLVFAVD